ncbi:Gfo/Idh/MocA family protein [Verrucomicrobiota bacterium]
MKKNRRGRRKMNRRNFLRASAAAGAGIMLNRNLFAKETGGTAANDINVAIIGSGAQGRILINDSIKISNIRFKAVCDIWEFSKNYGSRSLKARGHDVAVYEDYRVMLEKEKDLDAVIVATPDWVHAEHAIAAMEAGHHVYCEKEMSHRLDVAKTIVHAAEKTGQIVQIGHQRRSNPVYKHALELIKSGELCGKIKNCYGQWNRPVQEKMKWSPKYEIPLETLAKYGYANMDHFKNWRWYKKYSAGPIADLGSHQIDIFSWFLGSEPHSLMAVGGNDYYSDRDWYEDVMAIYEYNTKYGSTRAFYQVLNTSSFGNYFERFLGDKGTLTISEGAGMCYYVPEAGVEYPAWMDQVERVEKNGHMAIPLIDALTHKDAEAAKDMKEYNVKNPHQFHLENFFGAIRKNDKSLLSCPPDIAYDTAVAVLNVIPAIAKGKKVALSESLEDASATQTAAKKSSFNWQDVKEAVKVFLD